MNINDHPDIQNNEFVLSQTITFTTEDDSSIEVLINIFKCRILYEDDEFPTWVMPVSMIIEDTPVIVKFPSSEPLLSLGYALNWVRSYLRFRFDQNQTGENHYESDSIFFEKGFGKDPEMK